MTWLITVLRDVHAGLAAGFRWLDDQGLWPPAYILMWVAYVWMIAG